VFRKTIERGVSSESKHAKKIEQIELMAEWPCNIA